MPGRPHGDPACHCSACRAYDEPLQELTGMAAVALAQAIDHCNAMVDEVVRGAHLDTAAGPQLDWMAQAVSGDPRATFRPVMSLAELVERTYDGLPLTADEMVLAEQSLRDGNPYERSGVSITPADLGRDLDAGRMADTPLGLLHNTTRNSWAR